MTPEGDLMMEEVLYQSFVSLTDMKKLEYLYTYLVEDDSKKLENKFGPRQARILITENLVVLHVKQLKDALAIKDGLIMDGMILLDRRTSKNKDGYIVTYKFEGQENPICLN